jgi:hypothetical protein
MIALHLCFVFRRHLVEPGLGKARKEEIFPALKISSFLPEETHVIVFQGNRTTVRTILKRLHDVTETAEQSLGDT